MRSLIATITTGKSGKIYREMLETLTYASPHKFVGEAYRLYHQRYPDSPTVNGKIFEYLVCETLAQSGIAPFYYQARFERVPNAIFDVVLYHKTIPVALTMKVSLRERYKQADLEGLALRQVYRRASSYLVTLEEKEAPRIVKKILDGDISGLDKCVLASRPEYDALLKELTKRQFRLAEKIMPIEGKAFPATGEG